MARINTMRRFTAEEDATIIHNLHLGSTVRFIADKLGRRPDTVRRRIDALRATLNAFREKAPAEPAEGLTAAL